MDFAIRWAAGVAEKRVYAILTPLGRRRQRNVARHGSLWILPVLVIFKLKLGEITGYLVLILGAGVLLWGFMG